MNHNSLSSLDALAHGAVSERFGRELNAALANISDPNTKATAKRTINLKITLAPDETRSMVAMLVEAKATLAPAQPVATALALGMNADGEVIATEIGRSNELPGQMNVDGGTFEPVIENLTRLDRSAR